MLRTHSLDPFIRILGMTEDEYERVVKAAQSELADRGESARIYVKVSILFKPPELPFTDCCPGMSCTDKGRRGPVLQALRKVHHVESNNAMSLRLTYSVFL